MNAVDMAQMLGRCCDCLGSCDLDRWAEANATLAGLFRRSFMRGAR